MYLKGKEMYRNGFPYNCQSFVFRRVIKLHSAPLPGAQLQVICKPGRKRKWPQNLSFSFFFFPTFLAGRGSKNQLFCQRRT